MDQGWNREGHWNNLYTEISVVYRPPVAGFLQGLVHVETLRLQAILPTGY
jgi:hypothetical protein